MGRSRRGGGPDRTKRDASGSSVRARPFEAAPAIEPGPANSPIHRAKALQDAARWSDAEAAYNEALAHGPGCADLFSNLGVVLHAQGRADEALAAFRRTLDVEPAHLPALGNLAKVLQSLGRFAEAEAAYRRAIALQPRSSDLHSGLGASILGQCRLDDVVALCRKAIELDGANGLASFGLGQAYVQMNRPADAIAAFERGLTSLPGSAEGHVSLGQALLATGDYRRGWAEYEWRWKTTAHQDHIYHALPHPLWQGEPLDGLTILLHQEQGIGDNIQFVRYVPALLGLGARVVLAAPPSLHRLFRSIEGMILLTPDPPPPPIDVRAALMSLPRLFQTLPATIPAAGPYLGVAQADIGAWRAALGAEGPRIGLVWAGNSRHANDRNRSLPLSELTALFNIEGVRWFSLQKEPPAHDLATLARLGDRLVPLELGDFYDTAAAVCALDLVISVDTSVCHLAGALGRSVWIMLPFAAEWRWMLDREDSPWYPSARLFRQPAPGDWPAVIARLAEEIGAMALERGAP